MKVNTALDEKRISIKNKIVMKKNSLKSSVVEDRLEQISSDSSQDSFLDECIFPSPIPISKEEAMRETQCHYARQNFRDLANYGVSADDGPEDFRHAGFLNPRSIIRREVEKPPRLQKQMSRDRLLPYNRQNVLNESPLNCCDSKSQGSSAECLDSTGVDVHEFLVRALQSNPRDRNILLKLERDMIKFCKNNENFFMRFPEMTSYHRMLVHRVAAYFGMDHNIDAKGKSVIINKTECTRIPEKSFRHHIALTDGNGNGKEEDGRRSILKRMKNCQSLDHVEAQITHGANWRETKQRSFEERENHYERTRARIFQEHSRNDHLRYKDKSTSQWKNRAWNSTDSDYSLENRSSPHASNHSSKSGMTILSRQSNLKKDSISSSSSTSSLFQPLHHDPAAVDHPLSSDNDHLVNHQPLQYPQIGVPYANFESQQPSVYHQPPVVIPSYAPPPYYSNVYPSDATQMPTPHGMSGVVQNDLASPEIMNPSSFSIFPPPNHIIYPYQPVPLPVYTYPVPPVQQHGFPVPCSTTANGLAPGDNLANEMSDLKLNVGTSAVQVEDIRVDLASVNATCSDLTSDLSNSDDARSHDHDDVLVPNCKSQCVDKPSDVDSADAVAPSLANLCPTEAVVKDSDGIQSAEIQPNYPLKPQQINTCVSTTVSTGLGSITYYTADHNRSPIRAGSSGQPVFLPPSSSVYPVGMIPYGFNGKLTPHPINPNCVDGSSEYFAPGNSSVHPGFTSPIPGFAPAPFYYMVNNQRMEQCQAVPFQNLPFFYTPAPNAYPPPQSLSQTPANTDVTLQNKSENKEAGSESFPDADEDDDARSLYPMSLRGSMLGIDDPKVNSFAANFKAKIIQLSDDDDKENLTKDVFLLFASSKVAFKAQEAMKKLNGMLLFDVDDVKKAKLLRHLARANKP